MSWLNLAACRDRDPEMFALPLSAETLAEARWVCAGCAVARPCLDEAGGDRDTVRGGLTPDERDTLVRDR